MADLAPGSLYFDLIVQLREHIDVYEAEYHRFSEKIAPLLKEGKPAPPAVMALWAKRVRSWLSVVEAYRPTAQRFAEAGEPGMLAYVDGLTAWMAMMLPDAEDTDTQKR